MPEVPRLKEPLGHDYTGCSVGGPSDLSWQGPQRPKGMPRKEWAGIEDKRQASLFDEQDALDEEASRLMERDGSRA